jgi:hypothetical protein
VLAAVIGGSIATAQQIITCEVDGPSTNVCLQEGSGFDPGRTCPQTGGGTIPCPDQQMANPQPCPTPRDAMPGEQGRREATPLTRNCEFTQMTCVGSKCMVLTPSVSTPVVCSAVSGASCIGTGPGGGGGGGGPPSELPPEE